MHTMPSMHFVSLGVFDAHGAMRARMRVVCARPVRTGTGVELCGSRTAQRWLLELLSACMLLVWPSPELPA